LAWQEYRRLSRRFWLLLILGVPGMLVTFAALALLASLALDGRGPEWVRNDVPLAASGLLWGAVLVRANSLQMRWRCPRCGEAFFGPRRLGFHSVSAFARRCRHCGLAKWAVENRAPAA
jgi:hypothetical protein